MNRKTADVLKKVRMVCVDVDGVLTDGGIIIASDGSELKRFDVKDGTGISLGHYGGLEFSIISGRYSKVIDIRAKELKIRTVYQGAVEKISAYEDLKKKTGFKDGEICYIGDEIIDLPVFEKCAFSAAPSDAVPEVKKAADYVCKKPGGKGCVREVIDIILKASGRWEKAVSGYLRYEKPSA
ncbi:MAG TPA: HAD hydrolase family protein [Candidatus Goldiibacteriota bacterium]|nr:HAD hydrolase family protein [Candidatus Goldiibacteriota bacterium]